jgi:Tfp pilus assembly protein PilF
MSRIVKLTAILIFCSAACVSLVAQSPVTDRQREIRRHFVRAQQAIEAKQFGAAIEEFDAILALEPKNIDARGNLGVVQFLSGRYSDADQNLRAALRLRPSLLKAQAILGLCEKAQGHFDSARDLLERSVPHLQQDVKIQMRAGLALVELDYQHRDLEKALATLTVLQNAAPTNADVLFAIYRIHTDLATQARHTLAMVAPDSARMHQLLAQYLINEGDAKKAITQYREALRLDPLLPGAHFELGEAILIEAGVANGKAAAQEEFEAALAIDPRDAKSECRLGALMSLSGENESAQKHYQRAIEINPNEADARVGLGKILMSTHPDEALRHLLAAVRSDPTNAQAHFRLAQLYRRLGRDSDADRETRTFHELRGAEERLSSAYQQIYKKADASHELNPDVPQ